MTLDPTQFQQLLAAINALHGDGWRQWTPVLTVPVSAFFAMLVGIRLEMYKTSREQKKRAHEKLEKEVSQINIAIIGIAYNIETLVHIVVQNILPHYKQSHTAYKALHEVKGDSNKLSEFFISLYKYPALMMTSPEIHFVEVDFFREMPFIAEKDPNLVKDAGWLVGRTRAIHSTMNDRNRYIEAARGSTFGQGGALNFWQLDSILQTMTSIANKECMIALEFFELFLRINQQLEGLNATYKIDATKSKLVPPEPLAETMKQLREIAEPLKKAMPT